MKLLLIRETSSLYRYSNTSYGLGVVGTIASEIAHVKIIDNNSLYKQYSNAELLAEIRQYSPDVIGFNVHAFNILATTRLIAAIKNHFPEICLLAGGLHTYSEPYEVLETGVHIVVKGEADCTIKPLLGILEGALVNRNRGRFVVDLELATKLSEVQGLCFEGEGCTGVTDTGNPVLIQDLDLVPFVNYDLFNLDDYLKRPGDEHYVTNVMITQRGCPYPCPFCRIVSDASISKVRENSTKYRIEYVKYLYEKYRPHHIVYYDNNFTLNRQSVIDFCHQFVEGGFSKVLSFSCQTNVVLRFDDSLLQAMKEANCTEVGLGIERLSKIALNKIKKNKNYESIIYNIDMLNKYNIDVLANCLLGFPFDTQATIEEESKLFEYIQSKIRVFSINNLLPPPGTEVYELTRHKKWYLDSTIMNWKPSFYHLVYNFSNNAWDVNFFDLDNQTQNAIREMKERFYSITIENMESPLLNALHQIERSAAIVSLFVYRFSPALENFLFYIPKKIRYALHSYFLSNYYVRRSVFSREVGE